ncbi:MAG: hypothetical protein EOO47_10630, partial [Flavobacterium sp.]
MQPAKLKSFTLAELLVVMIITVIVVGIAFSVLSLVQKQISTIEKNFRKTTELSLLEQQLWQDFNTSRNFTYFDNKMLLTSDIDTIFYSFNSDYSLRQNDTIPVKIIVKKVFYKGVEVKSGQIDAISISAEQHVPDYFIFVSGKTDAALYMNS